MRPPSYDELDQITIDPSRSSSDHHSPSESTVAHSETKPKLRRRGFGLGESWTWEICSAVLSVIGITLLIGFLVSIHEKPYARWQYTVSPNTVISIIMAFTKATLLSSVSACLGQLKWKLYERSSSAPLEHMQTIDEASRGSWGALKVISRVASGSKMGILTFSGALLTFLALAVDPFAQQILSFPSRQVQALNETASIQSAVNYTAPGKYRTADYDRASDRQKKAISSALILPDTGLQAQCSTEKCSYPSFTSLGICSKCEDVTERTTQECVGTVLLTPKFERPVGGMNCTYTAPYEYKLTLSVDNMTSIYSYIGDQASKVEPEAMGLGINFWATYSRIPPNGADLEEERYKIFDIEAPIVSFISTVQQEVIFYTKQNRTAWPPKPSFTECAMYWCEKEYLPSNFSATSEPSPISRTQKLQIIIQDKDSNWMEHAYKFVTSPDSTPLPNKSSVYHVSQALSWDLSSQLSNLFDQIKSSDTYSDWHILEADTLPDVVKSLSTTLTDAIRSADVGSKISGKALRTETYIHVRWPWIILPVFVALASTILLLATTVATKNTVLWKNSLLPLLRSYCDTAPEENSIPLRSDDEATPS